MTRKIRRTKNRTMLLRQRKKDSCVSSAQQQRGKGVATYAARSSSRIVIPPTSAEVQAREVPHGKAADSTDKFVMSEGMAS